MEGPAGKLFRSRAKLPAAQAHGPRPRLSAVQHRASARLAGRAGSSPDILLDLHVVGNPVVLNEVEQTVETDNFCHGGIGRSRLGAEPFIPRWRKFCGGFSLYQGGCGDDLINQNIEGLVALIFIAIPYLATARLKLQPS
ncbi:MAG: hypothetical protein OXC62_07060 [Aestuariivita sp.]|nr:hypothetical protein [Aestuariivita sp.]